MSANKRRKVDGSETPKSAHSAISALAAKRRLAAGTPDSLPETASVEEADSPIVARNSFSALQNIPQGPDVPASISRVQQKPSTSGRQSPATRSQPQSEVDREPAPVVQYSSFRLASHNHRIRDGGVTELRLSNERFVVLGSFGVEVIAGGITLLGATLTASPRIHWVHAPQCHGVPVIRTLEKTSLKLHPHPAAHSLRQLERLSPLFRRLWNEQTTEITNATYQIVFSSESLDSRSMLQPLVTPAEWNKILTSLAADIAASDHPRRRSVLLCGPKSSGKSTFSRYLINRILTAPTPSDSVLVLDIDPGQPEFTPPGTLSLVCVRQVHFGIPFTNVGTNSESFDVLKSHALASVTPASATALYQACVWDLLHESDEHPSSVPLVINTAGWILGTGLDLLESIIQRSKPTEVVYMSEDGPIETLEVLRNVSPCEVATLPSQPSTASTRTAAQLRSMQMMSYFHRGYTSSGESAWNSRPLSTIRPLQIHYGGGNRGILGILPIDYEAPIDMLHEAINGMVLAIVVVEDKRAFGDLETAIASSDDRGSGSVGGRVPIITTSDGLPVVKTPENSPLDPCYSRLLGLLLVRGVDTQRKVLEVLTPVQVEQIRQVRSQGHDIVLAHGNFDTPHWAYTEHLYEQEYQELDLRQSATKAPGLQERVAHGDDGPIESVSEPESEIPGSILSSSPPWVEVLKPNERRPVGSQIWRVRRDLGKSQGNE